ncbi:hypothetical protein BS47DRAFT_23753 [Hydnum rufescens UP504]|uniref:Uncharacterized protein n=1 Tax=Hydnum rufescens UP504 TaxID=1448309 RepID=A0A9P6BAK5_9AGAM|nr:hypothetical protein BS47DRAFT_23753 [Hydnum rufescens UP504]
MLQGVVLAVTQSGRNATSQCHIDVPTAPEKREAETSDTLQGARAYDGSPAKGPGFGLR